MKYVEKRGASDETLEFQEDILTCLQAISSLQTNTSDKRANPNKSKGCAGCNNFMTKDGKGYCKAFKSEQSCGKYPCQEYKSKDNKMEKQYKDMHFMNSEATGRYPTTKDI